MRTPLIEVLAASWEDPFSTKSNLAKTHADEVARAACLGLITTIGPRGEFTRAWKITPKGLETLWVTLGLRKPTTP